MADTPHMSMTPPLTPPLFDLNEDSDIDHDSHDYMDFFSGELESSPAKKTEVDNGVENGLVLFSCKGEVQRNDTLTDTSFLGGRCLAQLLQNKNPFLYSLIPQDPVFYLPCSFDNIFYNLQHNFLGVRQCIIELEKGSQSSVCLSQSCHDTQYSRLRESVAKFFNSLISYVFTLGLESQDEEFIRTVVAEMLDLLIFLKPLHDLPEHVTSAASSRGNKCSSAAYHLYHLHLDIRWWSLTLFHIVESTFGSLSMPASHPRQSAVLVVEPRISLSGGVTDSEEQSVFEQCLSMVLWDLITIMCREGLKKSVADLQCAEGFSCTCSQELGIMVLHLLDHRHTTLGKQSFWDLVKNKLLLMLKLSNESAIASSSVDLHFDCLQYPPPSVKRVRLPHVWWIFTNFSRLYVYDCLGKELSPKSAGIKSETKLLRTLVKLSFGEPRSTQVSTELELRFYVRSCLRLHHLWGGERSSEWTSLLWDYFSKHLDSNFLLPGAGLDGLACISKTAGGWLEQIKSRVPDPDVIGKSETSWQIFLRLVVGVVKSGPVEWRQIKGRIYSKFHGRKMLELSPMGLHNSTTLFLTLANTIDMIDVTNKLSELLAMAPVSNISKSKVIWHGFFATVLLLVESGCNILPVAQKLTSIVASTCQEYITSRDAMHKRDTGQLFIIYAEGIQEIFEQSSDLCLAQHSLLCNEMNSLLHHCGTSEMKAILNAINTALVKVLKNSEKLHCLTVRAGMDIVDAVWKEFGIFIKSHATVLTPPTILGSIAASLTYCLAQFAQRPADGLQEAATGLFVYFTSNEAVSTLCSLQYIIILLSEPDCIKKISQFFPSFESLLISSWLSALVTQGEHEDIICLTPLVTSLPAVASLLHQPPASPFAAAKAFVKGVADRFAGIADFGERMAYRDSAMQYFSTLDRAYGTILKKVPLPDYLPSAIDLFSCLFYCCHSIIYIKSRPTCPLPSLLSTVVLPANVYSLEKPLSLLLSAALAQNIPKIVGGLSSLSLSQDPYLLRCMKDIFTHYIHRFPIKTNKDYTTDMHPFIICLHNADVREENLLEVRTVFLEVLRDNYITKRNISSVHLQLVISLLLELMTRGANEWVVIIVTLLMFPLLELLLTIEDQSTKRSATDLLQCLLEATQAQNIPPRRELLEILQKFVIHHISWSSHRLFRVLGVIGVINRTLMVDCLPYIANAVKATEEKRGTGLDHTLRHGYQNLLTRLGLTEDDTEGVEKRLCHGPSFLSSLQ